MTKGAQNSEAALTPQIMRGFGMAGCAGLYKIPDPRGTFVEVASERPCDFIGVMPDGRALHCEVKVARANHQGKVLGFGPNVFQEHQLTHLAAVDKNGGCAVVAFVSFYPGMLWKLYLWRWSDFARATNAHLQRSMRRQMSARDMRKKQGRHRVKDGKHHYWNVSSFVDQWVAEHPGEISF